MYNKYFLHFFRFRLLETCCSCCTCVSRDAPRTRQIYSMLDNIEQYKRLQLEKLRENYAVQVSITSYLKKI